MVVNWRRRSIEEFAIQAMIANDSSKYALVFRLTFAVFAFYSHRLVHSVASYSIQTFPYIRQIRSLVAKIII